MTNKTLTALQRKTRLLAVDAKIALSGNEPLQSVLDMLYSWKYRLSTATKMFFRYAAQGRLKLAASAFYTAMFHKWSRYSNRYQALATSRLGHESFMLGSKSLYSQHRPEHITVFNANLVVGKTKIWYGDLDLTERLDDLIELSIAIGRDLHVLYEMDGRFDRERNPDLSNPVVTICPQDASLKWSKYHTDNVKMRPNGTYVYSAKSTKRRLGLVRAAPTKRSRTRKTVKGKLAAKKKPAKKRG